MAQPHDVQFAEAVIFFHGTKAEEVAEKQANLCEKAGARKAAMAWRNLRLALKSGDSTRDLNKAA